MKYIIIVLFILQILSAIGLKCRSRDGTHGTCTTFSQCRTADPNTLTPCAMTGLYCCTPKKQENWVWEDCGTSPLYNVGSLDSWTSIEPDEYSWLASLEYGDRGKGSSVCSGSVVSPSYVLTAAHCVEDNFVKNLGGLIGVRLADNRGQHQCDYGTYVCPHFQRYGMKSVITHPSFGINNEGRITNNIALLELDRRIEFDDTMKPICLPFGRSTPNDYTPLIASGWGTTSMRRGRSIKRAVKVQLESCPYRYANQFCGKKGNRRACNGDLGGPLMYRTQNNIMVLEGIATECNDLAQTGVFIQVRQFEDWIRGIIWT